LNIKEHLFRPAILARFVLGLAGLTVLVGIAAPYLDADAFRGSIQNVLEETLGRKIEIGRVRFSLFAGPGFTLERVTIEEDPRYGLEPFAFIPTLEVRVRLDKLLMGQIRPLGLRLVDASLNLAKSDDGTWNAVALVERLGAPRRTPFNFFPAVQMENGRVDFKLGNRKSTFYLTETDLSIYPESSGKIYFRFEGSPARTDRAGNGFGHLTGTANWYLKPAPASGNQLEADVNLEPSNLSELSTLFQGQDMGVHGNVSAHVVISGPFSSLHALGDMRLDDVHRWDLMPSPGDSWRVRFRSQIDLEKHTLELATLPLSATDNPLMLQFKANEFMTHPSWSVLATMHKAPLAALLPLGRRMGMALPAGLQMDGALDGVIGFSNVTGMEGGVVISNAVANIPNVPPLRSASANVTISGSKIHIDPAILQSDTGGTLRAGGDFDLASQNLTAEINADQFSIAAFKQTTNAWFGPGSPQALALMSDGKLSGNFGVHFAPGGPVWSGQGQFSKVTMDVPGLALPVLGLQGKFTMDEDTFDLPHLSGTIGDSSFTGSYRYAAAAKHPEHLRLQVDAADLSALEADFAPTISDQGLLAHLPFTRRSIPAWLASRSMEGELDIAQCSVNQAPIGPLSTHFVWQGTAVQLAEFKVKLPEGNLQGSGSIALSARLPRYRLALKVDGYPWSGGLLKVAGSVDTSGMGLVALQHLEASGDFSADGVTFSSGDPLSSISGRFTFAFNGATPLLKLTKVQARQGNEDWVGEGGSNAEGKVLLDLVNGERQVHLAADLMPEPRP
jgi:uncharacterized protein involved in outer membrane biogenesis